MEVSRDTQEIANPSVSYMEEMEKRWSQGKKN
jgi:hypothetical protein